MSIQPYFGGLFPDEPLPKNGKITLDQVSKPGFGCTLKKDGLRRPYPRSKEVVEANCQSQTLGDINKPATMPLMGPARMWVGLKRRPQSSALKRAWDPRDFGPMLSSWPHFRKQSDASSTVQYIEASCAVYTFEMSIVVDMYRPDLRIFIDLAVAQASTEWHPDVMTTVGSVELNCRCSLPSICHPFRSRYYMDSSSECLCRLHGCRVQGWDWSTYIAKPPS